MDSKWLIKREIKEEEPVEYFLTSSELDGELNVSFDAYSNKEQLAVEISSIQVKQERRQDTAHTKQNEGDLVKNKKDKENVPECSDDDMESSTGELQRKSKHKFHEVFVVDNGFMKGPPYACNICLLTFPTKKILKVHRSIHKGKKFQCDICKKVFPTKSHIYAHMKVHREPKFCCPICTKTFALHKSFVLHQTVHEEKKFECSICSKPFRQKGQVTEHMKIHRERTRDCKCKICDAAYYEQRTLNRHMKRIHSTTQRKRYRCPNTLCDKNYLTLSSFRTHACAGGKRSESLMTAKCPECSRSFYNRFELNRHIQRVHVRNPNDFKCSECDKTYLYRFYDLFVQHVAQNCATRFMYECDYCSIVMPSKSKLFDHFINGHKFVVDTANVHSCPHCSKIFFNRINLKFHLKKKHIALS